MQNGIYESILLNHRIPFISRIQKRILDIKRTTVIFSYISSYFYQIPSPLFFWVQKILHSSRKWVVWTNFRFDTSGKCCTAAAHKPDNIIPFDRVLPLIKIFLPLQHKKHPKPQNLKVLIQRAFLLEGMQQLKGRKKLQRIRNVNQWGKNPW